MSDEVRIIEKGIQGPPGGGVARARGRNGVVRSFTAEGAIPYSGLVVDADGVHGGHVIVTEYLGVDPTGATDSSAGFLACLADATARVGGCAIEIPEGCRLKLDLSNGPFELTSAYPIRLFGHGYQSVIECEDVAGLDCLLGESSNCTVEGIRFIGPNRYAVHFARPDVTNIADCAVLDCWFEGCGTLEVGSEWAPIAFIGVDRAKANRNKISGSGVAGNPGLMTLTDTSGAPRTFDIGDLVFSDEDDAAKKYRNMEAVTLGANATLTNIIVTSTLANSSSLAGKVTVVKDPNGTLIPNATCTNALAFAGTNPGGYEILFKGTDNHYGSEACDNHIVMLNSTIGITNFNGEDFKARGNDVDGGGFYNASWTEAGYGVLCYEQLTHVVRRARVTDNHVTNCAGMGIYVQGFDDSVVSNNTVEGCALRLDSVSLEAANITIQNSDGCTVNTNTSRDAGGVGDGIGIATSQKCTVGGNIIRGCAQSGIRLRGVDDGAIVQGNTIDDCTYGIRQNTAASNFSIAGNTVRDSSSIGIYLQDLSDSDVSGNIVTGSLSTGLLCAAGTRNKIRGNLLSNVYDLNSAATYTDIYGNTFNPSGANALGSSGDYCWVHSNRYVTGAVTVTGTGAIQDVNRVSTALILTQAGRDFVDHGRVTGGSVDIDCAASRKHYVVLGSASTAITFSNAVDGLDVEVHLAQDGLGSRVVTWPYAARFGSFDTTLSTRQLLRDVFAFSVAGAGAESTFFCRSIAKAQDLNHVELWDADNGVALTGADVDSWTGMFASYVITPPGNKPTLDATGINGANAVKFVGASSQWLTNNSTAGLYGAADGDDPDITVVVQLLCATAASGKVIWFWGGDAGASANRLDLSTNTATSVKLFDNGGSGSASVSFNVSSLTAAARVLATVLAGQTQNQYTDNVLSSSTPGAINATSRTAIRFSLGAYSNGTAGTFFDGWIRRLDVLRSPTTADLKLIQDAWSAT